MSLLVVERWVVWQCETWIIGHSHPYSLGKKNPCECLNMVLTLDDRWHICKPIKVDFMCICGFLLAILWGGGLVCCITMLRDFWKLYSKALFQIINLQQIMIKYWENCTFSLPVILFWFHNFLKECFKGNMVWSQIYGSSAALITEQPPLLLLCMS